MNCVHWLSPGDPAQRTGGYLYNARISDAMRDLGVLVEVVVLDSVWPIGGDSHADALDAIPDGATVVADGLLWPGLLPEERARLCERTRVWVVVHSLMDKEGSEHLAALEVRALCEAEGCFATSMRTADIVAERMGREGIPVVVPGTEAAPTAAGPGKNRLLAVGHVIPRKGYRRLLEALAQLTEVPWSLDIVGSLERDREHAIEIQAVAAGLAGRVRFLGELDLEGLDRAYADADCLVHAAHFEAYGMVLTEALKRGLPVISTPAGALDTMDSDAIKRIDEGDIGAALSEWLANPTALASARTAALSMEFPTWAGQAQKLVALLGFEEHSFSVEWLELREPFDHAARSVELAQALNVHLGTGPVRLVELGAGLGSGARFVSQYLDQDCHWTLVDRDPRLLGSAALRLPCETVQMDVHDLASLPEGASAVTLQALLDLVSDEWLVGFADWLAGRRLALLAALTVDGRIRWSPPHAADDAVAASFRHHQTWDRGFGASVGVNAAERLSQLLQERGYSVQLRDADWSIPPSAREMVTAMVDGTAHAAEEAAVSAGVDPHAVASWTADRRARIGSLGLMVGHKDLLALPSIQARSVTPREPSAESTD